MQTAGGQRHPEILEDSTMVTASDSTLVPTAHAVFASETGRDLGLFRRDLIQATAAALVGTITGAPKFRASGPDISAVVEGWLEDARALGIVLIMGPDGHVWRSVPIYDGNERAGARDAHWMKLERRPRLKRAVYAAVERRFKA
ncbi:hypothetical protein [Methylobacterium komagatae]